jgi:hypothetical protein
MFLSNPLLPRKQKLAQNAQKLIPSKQSVARNLLA